MDQGQEVQDRKEGELTQKRIECNKGVTMQTVFHEQEAVQDRLVEHDKRKMMKKV